MGVGGILSRIFRHSTGPRLSARSVPRVLPSVPGTPETVDVAGREYAVVDQPSHEMAGEPCPWCLCPILPGDDVIVCANPSCRSVGHRAHVEQFGCGGICSVT